MPPKRAIDATRWLRKGFGFVGAWAVCEQDRLMSVCFGLPEVTKPKLGRHCPSCGLRQSLRQAPRKRLPSDYYNLAIFFEPRVRNRPSVTVLQQVICYETALPKIAKLQCDLDT